MSEYLPGSSKDPTIFQNSNKDSEYWPSSNPWEGQDSREVMLDMALIGQAVLGLRAYLQPEKYGDSDFVKRSIGIAETMGYITPDGVQAPVDILDIAYPQTNGNH